MSFEVEVKYRTKAHDDIARRLAELGARAEPEVTQEDAYMSHPARDFGQTNEALRIRRIGELNRITYKGPRLAGPTKTREEIEIAFSEGPESFEQLVRLFANLGFRPVGVIRKRRRPFHLNYQGHEVEVGLDVAEGLGEFVEVEVIALSEFDLAASQGIVLDLARALSLTEVEPRSYLTMFLEERFPQGVHADREHPSPRG
jgi:adenylate cyclase class 2